MKSHTSRKDIKVGVIGYGGAFNMGRSHLREMQAAGMCPTAVAEIDPSLLAIATEDFPGIATFESVTKMLKQSDVCLVVIITPHNTHSQLALQCLRAGRHVVCEKPLAITTRECDAMIAAAKKHRVVLSTYHNRHWDGWILRAVEQIKKKRVIGDIVRIDCRMGRHSQPGDWWRTNRTISGGVLYDWGVHLLEYCLQLVDSDIIEVGGFASEGLWASKTRWKNDTNEDEGHAVVRFRNGNRVTLTITHLDANPKPGFLEVTGTHGSYVIDAQSYTLFRPAAGGKLRTEMGPHYKSRGDLFYENIAAHLTGREKLIITPEWSRRPIHILDLAMQSAKRGRTLPARYS